MVVRRGEIWWASLPAPSGSDPGYRRLVVVVQADSFNRSRIRTMIAVALTTNERLAEAPGNVLLSRRATGLPNALVANVSQIITIDRSFLTEKVRLLPAQQRALIDAGIRLVLSI